MWRERPASIGSYLQPTDDGGRDRRGRRIGCLPLVILFFIGSFLLRATESLTDIDIDGDLVVVALVVGFVVFALIGRRLRNRQTERRDTIDDGTPTSTSPRSDRPPAPPATPLNIPTDSPSPTSRPRPAPPPPGRPPTSTESVTQIAPEAESLRRRLADAVADIASEVDQAAARKPVALPNSEEMIARAKLRIKEMGEKKSTD